MKHSRKDNYKINSYDADFTGKLHLPALTRFMQETAWRHSEELGIGYTDLKKKGMAWVLYKQVIKMDEWPNWGDEVTLQTWTSGVDKLLWYREFELSLGDKILGSASTSWLVINMENRRPVRTSKFELGDIAAADTINFPEEIAKKMILTSELESARNQLVYLSDIDVNNHVTNSSYPMWCMNSYTPDFVSSHKLVEIEIQFIAEALHGEELIISSDFNDITRHEHLISHENKELFKLVLKWEKTD